MNKLTFVISLISIGVALVLFLFNLPHKDYIYPILMLQSFIGIYQMSYSLVLVFRRTKTNWQMDVHFITGVLCLGGFVLARYDIIDLGWFGFSGIPWTIAVWFTYAIWKLAFPGKKLNLSKKIQFPKEEDRNLFI